MSDSKQLMLAIVLIAAASFLSPSAAHAQVCATELSSPSVTETCGCIGTEVNEESFECDGAFVTLTNDCTGAVVFEDADFWEGQFTCASGESCSLLAAGEELRLYLPAPDTATSRKLVNLDFAPDAGDGMSDPTGACEVRVAYSSDEVSGGCCATTPRPRPPSSLVLVLVLVALVRRRA